MKKYLFSIFLFLVSVGVVFGQKLEPKEKIAFDEIVYKRLKAGEYEKIHKWVTPIYYKVLGDSSKYIIDEIDTTFSQLRKLTNLEIRKSNDDDEINFIIVLSTDGKLPASVSGTLSKYTSGTGGYTYRANKKSEIYRMENLHIISKYNSKADVRFAVKIGVLTGMGLFKRTETTPSSIFYSSSNRKLKIDAFDAAIIAAFYHQNIKPGMTKDEVDPLFQ